jgi:bifunctional DNA-binding transcriptional regulator/antitoxin component of YhaV-PrlF toxin-antitoxin module
MNTIITMDKFGRLVIPKSMRRVLQISQTAVFRAEAMGNKVELTLLIPESGAVLKRRRGFLVVSSGTKKT